MTSWPGPRARPERYRRSGPARDSGGPGRSRYDQRTQALTTPEAVVAKKNSLDEMRDEAYRRQDNLASDIDELIDRVNPKNAAQRWKNEIVGSVKRSEEAGDGKRSEEHTSELQSRGHLVCRLLL